MLGHNNILNQNIIEKIKSKYKTKIALWYEDHLIKGGPNYLNNLHLIEKNKDLIDQYFLTIFPDLINTKIPKHKMHFMPIPADKNIENLEIYNSNNRYKDLILCSKPWCKFWKTKIKKY